MRTIFLPYTFRLESIFHNYKILLMDLNVLASKVRKLEGILANTQTYRDQWHSDVKPMLHKNLEEIIKATDLKAKVDERTEMDNLEAIVLDMGQSESGIRQRVTDDISKTLIRYNGMLVYQQLFNGKIIVMIVPPYVEGVGEPNPPKTLEILRPDELTLPFIIRQVETLVRELTDWEDYDDDKPAQTIGFNTGAFKNSEVLRES